MEALRAEAGIGVTRIDRSGPSVGISVETAGPGPVSDELAGQAAEVADQHPALLSLSPTEAVRVSDLVVIKDFWHTEVYERMHGYLDGRYPMAMLLHASPTEVMFIGAHRSSSDFADEDVEALELIQRPLAAALAFRAALDATTAVLRGDPSESLVGLVPAAALCAEYRPTRREAEVLTLAAAGWTNVRIARQLGIAERTVRKHLSSVYEQSGRSGRAAAAAWWAGVQENG
ncbi:helix-turn-helix transcriptional regulator [Terrabacter sp. C0L_2]|uniref:helix-turn-helix transcriptional regulator n=1 Tax=Terrabacter sp. C0L_2 TaxID=3108389 RepID=UPI002ED0431F|nr:helix-turn-helix transcriptional regulator [Terrabacter sp. C0L_2]